MIFWGAQLGESADSQNRSDGKAVKPSRKHKVWSRISGKNYITFILFGLVLIFWPCWSAETTELPVFVPGI